MPAWLFQTVDKNRIELIEREYVDRWCVRRYCHEMQRGDLVFIWLGGSAAVRGVHGWGKLVVAPCTDSANLAVHVDVCYEQRAAPFLPATTLRCHPVLDTLPILHMPRATNFRLEAAHVTALADLLNIAPNA